MARILIVDDSKLMRTQLKDILVQHGYEIVGEAGSGRDAVKKAKLLRPDLILMDVIMPTGNGIEATKMITAMDEKAKVLFLSTDNQGWRVKEAVIAGGRGYLRKPFTPEELLTKIEELLKEE